MICKRLRLSQNARTCHSEPVTDVTGVGIRNPHVEKTDCHDHYFCKQKCELVSQ